MKLFFDVEASAGGSARQLAVDIDPLAASRIRPGDPQRSDAARAEENEQSGAKKLGHALPG